MNDKEISRESYLIVIGIIPFHPCETIVSQGWNDRSTGVKRSFHKGETIKNQAEPQQIKTGKDRLLPIFYRKNQRYKPPLLHIFNNSV